MYILNEVEYKEAWKNKTGEMEVIEYLPEGDDIENWEKMFSHHIMIGSNDNITPLVEIVSMQVSSLESFLIAEPQVFNLDNSELLLLVSLKNESKKHIEITSQRWFLNGDNIEFIQFAYAIPFQDYNEKWFEENDIFVTIDKTNVDLIKLKI